MILFSIGVRYIDGEAIRDSHDKTCHKKGDRCKIPHRSKSIVSHTFPDDHHIGEGVDLMQYIREKHREKEPKQSF